jgi:hypothetical protein
LGNFKGGSKTLNGQAGGVFGCVSHGIHLIH